MKRLAVLLLTCVGAAAGATGDHNGSSALRFLCASDKAALYLEEKRYTGGGLGAQITWAFVVVDGKTGKEQRFEAAAQTETRSEELERVFLPVRAVDAKAPLARALAAAGKRCEMPLRPQHSPATGRMTYAPKEKALTLASSHPLLEGQVFERSVKLSWPVSPGEEEADVVFVDAQQVGTRTLLQLQVFGLTWDGHVLAGVDTKALRQAQSSLLNEVGLGLHRKGHYALALDWFGAAISHGPNPTASYNAACALARLGRAEEAVANLQALREQKGLEEKIAKDKDFDRIRESEALKAFLKGLF